MSTHLLLALMVVVACGKKQENAATTEDNTTTAATTPTQPSIDAAAAPPDAPPVESVASKHGYCEVSVTGDAAFNTRVAMQVRWVASDYWVSAETKAKNKAVEEEILKAGVGLEEFDSPLQIVCQDPDRGLFIKFAPALQKGSQIKHAPVDFTIVQKPEAKPGVIRAEASLLGGSTYPTGGILRVTRFEQGELEATFELEVENSREPPQRFKLLGKIVYHCAGAKRCGAG